MMKQEDNAIYNVIHEYLRSGIKHDISIKPAVICDIAKLLKDFAYKYEEREKKEN